MLGEDSISIVGSFFANFRRLINIVVGPKRLLKNYVLGLVVRFI